MTDPVIRHRKISTIPDDPVSVARGEVVPSEWNEDHEITGLEASLNLINPFLLMGG